MTRIVRQQFNRGEVTPRLHYRANLQSYPASCIEMTNFMVTPEGPAGKRPGTKFLAKILESVTGIWSWPMASPSGGTLIASITQEPSAYYMNVYAQSGERVFREQLVGFKDFDRIGSFQVNDVLFIFSGTNKMIRLERYTDLSFVVKHHEFDYGPYEDENAEDDLKIWSACDYYDPSETYSDGDYTALWCRLDDNRAPKAGTISYEMAGAQSTDLVDYDADLGLIDRESEYIFGGSMVKKKYRGIKFYVVKADYDAELSLYGGVTPPAIRVRGTATQDGTYLLFHSEVENVGGTDYVALYCHSNWTYYIETTSELTKSFTVTAGDEALFSSESLASAHVQFLPRFDTDGNVRTVKSIKDEHVLRYYRCVGGAAPGEDPASTPSKWDESSTYGGRVLLYSGGRSYGVAGWSARVGQDFVFAPSWRAGTNLRIAGQGETKLSGTFWFRNTEDEVWYRPANEGTSYSSEYQDVVTDGEWFKASVPLPSESMPASGTVELRTNGLWYGTVELQYSTDNGSSWDTLAVATSMKTDDAESASNLQVERDIEEPGSLIRVVATAAPKGGRSQCTFDVSVRDRQYARLLVEEEVLSWGDAVWATPTSPIENLAHTRRFAFDVFNDYNGYPTSMLIHDERMYLAGSTVEPLAIWASRINNWSDFQEGSLESNAVKFTLADNVSSKIAWMVGRDEVVVCTGAGQWTLGARGADKVLSAETVSARLHSKTAAAMKDPVLFSSAVGFISADGKKVYGTEYSFDINGYNTNSWSAYSEHIHGGGFRKLSYLEAPWDSVFALREDGALAMLTVDRQQEVFGWSKHIFGDGVIDIVTSPASGDSNVYMFVKRGDSTFIEVWDLSGDMYIDCYRGPSSEGVLDAFGIDGDTAWLNGRNAEEYVVRGASEVTVDDDVDFDVFACGVGYVGVLTPVAVAFGDSAEGHYGKISEVEVYTIKGGNFLVSVDEGVRWQEAKGSQGPTNALDANTGPGVSVGATVPVPGKYSVRVDSSSSPRHVVSFKSESPGPLTIAAFGVDFRMTK